MRSSPQAGTHFDCAIASSACSRRVGCSLVEGDEPLLGGAEDDRVLAAPADRVRVGVLARLQEGARLAQELHDDRVRLEDLLPGEALDLGQESPRLVHGTVDVEPVADSGEVVVPPVAGGGVDDPGAGVEGDVVGQEDGGVAVDPGVAEAQALEKGALGLGERRAESRRGAGGVALRAPARLGGLAQRLRDHQDVVRALERVEGVLGVRVDGEGEVGGERPGSGGPDDGEDPLAGERRVRPGQPVAIRLGERETHVDLGADVALVVLDLGLGERGPAGDAPVDRLLGLVDEALLGEGGELADDRRLVGRGHRQVGVLPLPEDPEPLELRALDAHELLGVRSAGLTEGQRRHLALLRPEVPVHLQLDRQAVAVPAGPVRGVVPRGRPAAHDHVLQDLVEHGAEVDVPVGVGRPVVEDEARMSLPGGPDLRVEVLGLPLLQPARLRLGEVGLHGEVRLREVQRRSQVGLGHRRGSIPRSVKRSG